MSRTISFTFNAPTEARKIAQSTMEDSSPMEETDSFMVSDNEDRSNAQFGFVVHNPNGPNPIFRLMHEDFRLVLALGEVISFDNTIYYYSDEENFEERYNELKKRVDHRAILDLDHISMDNIAALSKRIHSGELLEKVEHNAIERGETGHGALLERIEQIKSEGKLEFYIDNILKLINSINYYSEYRDSIADAYLSNDEIPYEWIQFIFTRDSERQFVAIDSGGEKNCGLYQASDYQEPTKGPAFLLVKMVSYTHNGEGFIFSVNTFRIIEYEGTEKMANLPVHFATEKEIDVLTERGKKYLKLVSEPTYCAYTGNATISMGMFSRTYNVSGRIMVDSKTLQAIDPNFTSYVESFEEIDNVSSRSYVPLDEVRVEMLPSTVYGFSFKVKTWVPFKVNKISDIQFREDAFDRLVLDEDYKRVIKALATNTVDFNDIVNGKGAGTIFLLYGGPGIGKTLTAEALAELQKRPLYMVSAGELGTTPNKLEENLSNIVHIAEAWDAIVLIDECDIFVEARSKSDIERNALVGIFLRELEYYQGIMFLTTNRADELDQAFMSRVSLGLHYADLTPDIRKNIWDSLLETMTTKDVDTEHLSSYDLNGRQIKHIIRLGATLANDKNRPVYHDDLRNLIDMSQGFYEEVKKTKVSA